MMERGTMVRNQRQGKIGQQPSRGPVKGRSAVMAIAMGLGTLLLSSALGTTRGMAVEVGATPPTLADGTYLYGETSIANEPGKGYLVFQVNHRRVVGAFYYPQSEFSCFTGELNQHTLEVLSLPTMQEPMSSFAVPLANLHAIQTVGTSERETLASCHQDVVAFLQNEKTALQMEP